MLQELLKNLEATKAQTLKYFDLPDTEMGKSYAPGKWTVCQLLHHIADAESVLYDRIRRAISKPGQVVWGFDQDAWAEKLEYEDQPMAHNKALYSAVRDAVIFMAKKYYEPLGENPFVHSNTGLRTLKDEFDKVAWHNKGHLEQIEKALEN